jgi:hypothetical protein
MSNADFEGLIKTRISIEQANVAVTLWTSIRELLVSNIDRGTGYLE